MTLPSDERLREAVLLLDESDDVAVVLVVTWSADGRYRVAGTGSRVDLVRRLRLVADHIEAEAKAAS